MRTFDGHLMLSASDLMRFMGCAHALTLDIHRLNGLGVSSMEAEDGAALPQPREGSEDAELLQKLGYAHEAAYLEQLKSKNVTDIEIQQDDLRAAAKATQEALEKGPDVVFQGALLGQSWGGWSDFLERVETPSELGSFSFEVTDTKLKRSPHPSHVMQLVLYSDLLADVQGVSPEFAHIELGNGERATLRLSEFSAYARGARKRLEAFIAEPVATRPVPCDFCSTCRWADHCSSVWTAEDSLFNVANITRNQVKKLEASGVETMEGLAKLDTPVRGLVEITRDRLIIQARLQHARKTGGPSWVLREHEMGKGFDLLPEPQPGDVFYDIEGDPHFEDGLEYLHGVWFDGVFKAFWAHSHLEEAATLAEFFQFLETRLAEYPEARIYHYAPYEITALRRLTIRYGVGEAFLDRLLREKRFVDLFSVVRGGLIGSEPNYSIKSMEAFYGLERKGEVKTGGGSIVAYEQWRENGEQHILDEIEAYNRIDCISTEELRNWLVSVRPEEPWPVMGTMDEGQEDEADADTQALRKMLASSVLSNDHQELLFNLGLFHKREAKPSWWAIFDSFGKDEEDLIDDLDALGGLTAVSKLEPIKRSMSRTYRFPRQETKLREGKSASIPTSEGMASVTVLEFDEQACEVRLKIGKPRAELLSDKLALHPDMPINTKVIAQALRDVVADQCGRRQYSALNDLLSRKAPNLSGSSHGDILGGRDPVSGTISAVGRMQNTVLPIQGPPGTGKTYVTARSILSLVRQGHRVGVSSNSHEAIRNVLMGCVGAQEELGGPSELEISHKVSGGEDGYPDNVTSIKRVTDNNNPCLESSNVVGGTAFFFSRDENVQCFDWLFVDEAGQVGLANLLAMGRAARNIVLVGDPCQLPQVIQGAHPHPANLSCLEWILGDDATIPLDRGIFLPTSRRMHPDVCRFISDQVYEGRLMSHADTTSQSVSGTMFPETGAFWVPVEHEGNAQVAPEEIDTIAKAVNELLSGLWTDKDNLTRPVRQNDIIVVAPYNAQVNALRVALPLGIRVGTVDKFQGQEAPICLVSMTASSAEETPRGMEFLFSLNRINVAVSRAKALALVFGAPRLLKAKCNTVEQMKLVNTLCALSFAHSSS